MPQSGIQCFADQQLDLDRPHLLGVLNVTPDSFSDGGCFISVQKAVDHALHMEDAGASFIDIGGESTRPGAAKVTIEEELERTIPVIQALKTRVDCLLSIDTSQAQVMTAAAAAGVHLINDVRALQLPGALAAAAATGLTVCLMHMQGAPANMQNAPSYDDVVVEVKAFLSERISACEQLGLLKNRIILDPGFGFGKTLQQNLLLLKHLADFKDLGCPLLAGLSRKSMLGLIIDRPVDERVYASVAAALLAYERGASFIRVHDVAATMDALKVAQALHDV